MITVLIEHPVTAYATWRQAYDRFAEVRRQAGVVGERVARPLGPDGNATDVHIVVALDFADLEAARAFVDFLRGNVWRNPDSSPGLAGVPDVRLLEVAPSGG